MIIRIMVGLILVVEMNFVIGDEGVSPIRIGLSLVLVICGNLYWDSVSLFSMMGGMLVGGAVLAESLIVHRTVGSGNGAVLILTGATLGWFGNVLLIAVSLILVVIYDGLSVALFHKSKQEVCYLFFILLAYLPVIIIQKNIMSFLGMGGPL